MPSLRTAAVAFSISLLGLVSSALAGLAPENVVVVVNGDSWASLTIANEYARVRGIPASNFIVLSGLSSIETIDVEHFRNEILKPVFVTIAKRGLRSQIDCITYSVDIPYAVDVSADMAGKKFPLVITGMASTNGLTYLHEWVEKKDTEYLRLDINRYSRRTLPLPVGATLSPSETAEFGRALDFYEQKKYPDAIQILSGLLKVQRSDPDLAYNLACCYSLVGDFPKAIEALQTAIAAGWRNAAQTASDADLKPLSERNDFKQLIEKMKSMPLKVQPGVSFHSQVSWGPAGEPMPNGHRYMLSTMLGVTCGRGNSVNEVIESIHRSAFADGTSPTGTIYFPRNGDVRSTTRAWAFQAAADELKNLGINAVVEDGILPVKRQDVAGAMIGISDFNWNGSKSTILPGAIVEHFTSFGGIISERAGQTPCTDFIRAGAAGTSGTVTEPYALQQKFPTAFMQVEYCSGFTLAESYYQSVSGPYQLLVIGDPLCRPWAKRMAIRLPGIVDDGIVSGTIKIRPNVPSADAESVDHFEIFFEGHLNATLKSNTTLAFNTKFLADGGHELSVVAVRKGVQQARSVLTVRIRVANAKQLLKVIPYPAKQAVFGGTVGFMVNCPGATSIEFMHLGRSIVLSKGPKGVVQIPTQLLGIGPVTLLPIANFATQSGVKQVFGVPIDFNVDPPKALSGKPTSATLSKGLSLEVTGSQPVIVNDTFDSNWLSKLCHGPNDHFTLSGVFDVPRADLYQLQMQTNTGATVIVDGLRVAGAKENQRVLAPLALQPGQHRIQLVGIAPDHASLDIRLGATGLVHLAEAQFKH